MVLTKFYETFFLPLDVLLIYGSACLKCVHVIENRLTSI